jgi:hypothetical protein
MRAPLHPSRILAVLTCAGFLVAAFAPCPPRTTSQHATAAEHPAGCPMHESADSLKPACPCGCGDRAPLAGSSVRLGVALPSSAPGIELVLVPAQAPVAAPLALDSFVPAIDHVPLPA